MISTLLNGALALSLVTPQPAAIDAIVRSQHGDPEGSIAATVALEGPVEGIPASEAELEALHREAQMSIEGYNATGDVAKLRRAHDCLTRWLEGHAKLYGYDEAAVQARAPGQRQLGMVESKLQESGAAVAPTPPPPRDPPEPAQLRTYKQLQVWGIVSIAVGVSTIVFITLPAWGLRDRALTNADEQRYYVDEQKYIGRARRRQNVMIGSAVVGAGLTALGIALTVVGTRGRNRLRREMAISPSIGPSFAGASATLRF